MRPDADFPGTLTKEESACRVLRDAGGCGQWCVVARRRVAVKRAEARRPSEVYFGRGAWRGKDVRLS
jgi:hypothetical protein